MSKAEVNLKDSIREISEDELFEAFKMYEGLPFLPGCDVESFEHPAQFAEAIDHNGESVVNSDGSIQSVYVSAKVEVVGRCYLDGIPATIRSISEPEDEAENRKTIQANLQRLMRAYEAGYRWPGCAGFEDSKHYYAPITQ